VAAPGQSWASTNNPDVDHGDAKKGRALVIIRGIAYAPRYVHYSGKRVDVDFRSTVDSVRKNVIGDLEEVMGFRGAVDVDLATYAAVPSDVMNELVETYRPRKIHLMHKDAARSSQREVFRMALSEIVENEDAHVAAYDIVVVIRFDTLIKAPLSSLAVNPGQINFLWREQPASVSASASFKGGLDSNADLYGVRTTSDVMHVFPPKYARALRDAVDSSRTSAHMHGVYPELLRVFSQEDPAVARREKDPPISFMFPEGRESNTDVMENPVYHIVRKRESAMLPGHTNVFWSKLLGSRHMKITRKG
jgi:hypothetical protein